MNIIGISQDIKISSYNKLEDTLDQNITILLKFCKLLPIPISNKLVDEKNNHHLYSFLNKIPLSGILLSGGNDLGSFPDRDNTQPFCFQNGQAKAMADEYKRKQAMLDKAEAMAILDSLI